jgi:hypothetical protein
MRTARALAAVALAATGVAASAQLCWACTCAVRRGMTARDYADAADVIFTGRVRNVVRDDPETNLMKMSARCSRSRRPTRVG